MAFHWASAMEEDKAKTMFSLIKYNGGRWKSEKQREFVRRVFVAGYIDYDNPDEKGRCPLIPYEDIKGVGKIDVSNGQFAVYVEGFAQWSDMGGRGNQPVSFVFVCDQEGIVTQYRLRYKGNIRDGMRPDPKQTEVRWKRT